MACFLCPRRCGTDREGGAAGVCGMTDQIKIARAAPHMWEEPPISGVRGSGTVFFSGCPLKCVFCQNRVLSADGYGKAVDGEELERIILRLAEQGVHNINLVTPTHFSDKLIPVLQSVRPKLNIPIVYNCGGYESVETLRRLEGLIDIYLPDFKYASRGLSAKYSGAPDYPEVAAEALYEMHRQCGGAVFDADGMMRRGVIVRHLVLPGCRRDSAAVMQKIADTVPVGDVKLSIMRQYTPEFVDADKFPELARRLTSFEYDFVVKEAARLGFDGFTQQKESATSAYTPNFDLTGLE